MPAFLSAEWLDLYQRLGADLPVVAGLTARVEHVVPGSPAGEVRYVVGYVDGQVTAVTAGAAADADDVDVSLTTKHADALRLLAGDLGANEAFMSGRTKVAGRTGPLLAVLALAGTEPHDALRARLAAAAADG